MEIETEVKDWFVDIYVPLQKKYVTLKEGEWIDFRKGVQVKLQDKKLVMRSVSE